MKRKKERIPLLDILKGIAVIFVINTHFAWEENQRLLGLFPFLCDMAVPIFMIVTGYLYAQSLKHTHVLEQAYKGTYRRIIRYIVPFIPTFVLEQLVFHSRGNVITIDTLLNAFVFGGYGYGSYYIPILFQIALLAPIIVLTMVNDPKRGIITWFCFNILYEFLKALVGLDTNIYRITVWRYVFLLSVGSFICLYKGHIKKRWLALVFIIGFVFIGATRYLGYDTKYIDTRWKGTSCMAALYIAPIMWVIIRKYHNVSFKPLEKIGKASYHIFLTQKVYYYACPLLINRYTDITILKLLFGIIICVTIGYIFYETESRFTYLIINKFSSKRGISV